PEYTTGYFKHVQKHEEIFQAADRLAEELENELVVSDNETSAAWDDKEEENQDCDTPPLNEILTTNKHRHVH
ncbi:unnamed protein product, partial [Didymodactylos carnosus]